MIGDYQAIKKTWFIRWQQKKIPSFGKNAGIKLLVYPNIRFKI